MNQLPRTDETRYIKRFSLQMRTAQIGLTTQEKQNQAGKIEGSAFR